MTRREGSARVAEALRASPPSLDELRRARIERRLLDHLPSGAIRSIAPTSSAPSSGGARGRAAWAAGGALVAMAAALALAWVAWPREHVEVARFELSGSSTASGTIDAGRTLEVGEGEHAQVQIGGVGIEVAGDRAAAPGLASAAAGSTTVMRFVSLDVRHVEVELTQGSIDVAFHPRERGRERLSIETPSARVEVVGTEFSVRLEGETTQVSVRHGVVRVIPRAPGERTVLLRAGESVAIGARAVIGASEASTPDAVPSDETEVVPEVIATAPAASSAGRNPRALTPAPPVTAGASAAPAELEILEPTPAVVDPPHVVPVTASQRLAAAQRVLDQGNHARARRMLAEVMRASDASVDVRVGAQTYLGDSFYSTREWQRAAAEYERAAAIGRGLPLGDAAIFALARTHQRLGDRDAALRTYLRYLEEAPHGANASQARTAICDLGGDPSVECGGSTR